ncbi:hypothetical protein ABW19_dt0202417 [Dactylella cylindrospora]|nr:hypothetical protein ABW19_dt0202417 [Dactylella cylindrospora]
MDDYGDIDDAAFAAVADAAEKAHASSSGSATRAPAASTSQTPGGKVVQPVPRKIVKPAGPSSIIVNTRQKGNPLLPYIKAATWEYGDIIPDYLPNPTTAILFLSLKYHRLHPEYIYTRIKSLTTAFPLRILLVLVDTEQHSEPLKELTKTSLVNNITIILSWSASEAGKYVESYKILENAPATMIKERQKEDYWSRVEEFVTSVKGVNRTDAMGLMSMFGSVRAAVNAGEVQVGLVPGWGEKKTRRWVNAVNEDFRVGGAQGKKRREEEEEAARAGLSAGGANDGKTGGMSEKEREALLRRLGVGGGSAKADKEREDDDMIIDIDADEEAAMFEAEEEERRRRKAPQAAVAPVVPNPAPVPAQTSGSVNTKPSNEDGVMAALAKLRKQ